ncbi:MAG: heat-shock protein Hsp20 [Rhodospirillales bacterium]|nr:MAG: heat-shock protein Hsp20 [Rhodospirillales bacterium]
MSPGSPAGRRRPRHHRAGCRTRADGGGPGRGPRSLTAAARRTTFPQYLYRQGHVPERTGAASARAGALGARSHEEAPAVTRVTTFNSPLLLGFDHLERVLEQISKTSSEGYPPYNIEQIGSDRLRITLAVAGFSIGDLSIIVEDNQLAIRGRKPEETADRVFLHRGIAARQFQRHFVLAEGIEVTGATLDNGLLHVDLKKRLPEQAVRTISIQNGAAAGAAGGGDQSVTVERASGA